MSWWVYLEDESGNILQVPNHQEGGTVKVLTRHEVISNEGETVNVDVYGNTDAELNVTYNYGAYFRVIFGEKGFNWLDGRIAYTTRSALKAGVQILGTDCTDDYWEQWKGNAGHVLKILLTWAELHPNGVWRVS